MAERIPAHVDHRVDTDPKFTAWEKARVEQARQAALAYQARLAEAAVRQSYADAAYNSHWSCDLR